MPHHRYQQRVSTPIFIFLLLTTFLAFLSILSSTSKKESSLNDLKVHGYLDSTSADEMAAEANTFDFILDTVSAHHSIDAYLKLLKLGQKHLIL